MKRLSITALLAAVAALGCSSETTGPGGTQTHQISMSFAASAAAPMIVNGDVTVADAQNTLIITSAELVLRDIELWKVGVQTCDPAIDDSCEKFVTGPELLSLPLDGTVSNEMTIAIDPGTYDRVEFDLHKVSADTPADSAFLRAHPDLEDTSLRVRGTWNGTPFEYVADFNESQRHAFARALIIDELTVETNVTVMVELDSWFVDAQGAVIDPTTALKGGANENLVRDNVRASFRAFEDADRDGIEDN